MRMNSSDRHPDGGTRAAGHGVQQPAASPDVLAITGAHSLERAAETQRLVAERLRPGVTLVLDLGGLTEADLSLLQIVIAARRTAAALGATLALAAGPMPAMAALVEAAGLRADEAERTFWNGMPT
jgi:hypothetical protein